MNAAWIIPFIILGGALQTCGAAMNGQLNKSLVNPFLASSVSFLVITFFFLALFFAMPHPLPTTQDIREMPWWAVFGGLVGAVQVFAGLTLIHRVGSGTFIAITVSSALIASLVIDHFGWFRMNVHAINPTRLAGALLLVGGVVLITRK
ncbi:transporter family-2 protein [Granulicella pectinivorans]|uniref:Transporter family-2 protein n=1 Tax=Granulicella pectinivorans TaxID=474950 RepID=A0A1I6MTA6_9BACT|nr:DMT family transporter [Granulicella pectinivorans]SFS18946.1 transporter family-2 protein [Granulicella pectinivorans]